MQEDKRTGLMEEVQDYAPMQGAAATAETACDSICFAVEEVLHKGQENAISAQDLCKCLGFNNVRELQHEIARERKAGAVILSTCQEGGGYFLPGSDQEVK